jgi:hypothetical protein
MSGFSLRIDNPAGWCGQCGDCRVRVKAGSAASAAATSRATLGNPRTCRNGVGTGGKVGVGIVTLWEILWAECIRRGGRVQTDLVEASPNL